jgi:hypothetical protein
MPGGGAAPAPGSAGAPGAGGGAGAAPGGAAIAGGCRIGPTPLRRLTRAEYDNTVRDLLGDKGKPSDGLPPDGSRDGFDNDVAAQGASPLLAGAYLKAAERIAGRVDLAAHLGCALDAGDDGCARAFIERIGRRAYRRPLRPAESTRLVSFYAANKGAYGFEGTLRLTLQLILSSPQFLYRLELTPAAPGQVAKLTPHEIASRLSYLLWGSMPDDALFAAADAGQLTTREQIARQAERLLADGRARPRARDFFRQWMALGELEDVMRDSKRYPGWSQSLVAAMEIETPTFAERLLFDHDGRYADLVTASFSYMNKALATYLGGTPVPPGSTFEKVMLDPARHAGIVTHAGPLAMSSKEDQPHPIYRGRWLRAQLLCHEPPPPPPSVMAETPMLADKTTTRALFAQHAADPSCAACHRLIDPVGFGLEQFDATGKWRATDRGLPIDTRGEIVDAGDASGPFTGAVELGRKLAKSDHAAGCLARQAFRYARGREGTADDRCALESVNALVKQAGGNLRALLVALTQTEDFVLKAGPAPAAP